MRKKIALILSLTLATGLMTFKVANANEREDLKAKESVIRYFNAFKNKDIDEMISLSDDERVESDNEHKELIEDLINDNYELKNYEIKNSKSINQSEYEFDVEINYMNNEKEKSTFKVVKENNDYVLKLGSDKLSEDFNDSRNRIEIVEENEMKSITPKSYKARWSTTITNKYYTNEFTCTGKAFVNAKQYSGNNGVTRKVEYAIVTKGLVSDTVHSSSTLNQNSHTNVAKIYLYQPSKKGVRLRLRNVGPVNSGDGVPYSVTCIGEVYNN